MYAGKQTFRRGRLCRYKLQTARLAEDVSPANVLNGFHGVLQVEVLYGDEPLKDYYTLMDIAYFYEWRRVSETFHVFDFETNISSLIWNEEGTKCIYLFYFFKGLFGFNQYIYI